MPDFQITNHGTIWTFTPLTCEASDWWQDNVENGPSFGRAFAVEHRMAEPILAAIERAQQARRRAPGEGETLFVTSSRSIRLKETRPVADPLAISVPATARAEAICRISAAIERTMRDLTDVCPWPQRGSCPIDEVDAATLAGAAVMQLLKGGACA